MSNRRIIISLMTVVLFTFSGCGMPSLPNDLISAPNSKVHFPMDDDMLTSLQALLPEGARLLTTPGGAGNHGISYGDLDGDGMNEAIVVYEEDGGREKTLKAALLMRSRHEAWQIVWHGEGSGYGLDYAGIHDVDRDGVAEILLGWSLGEGVNGLDIYEWDRSTLKLQDRRSYHESIDLTDMMN